MSGIIKKLKKASRPAIFIIAVMCHFSASSRNFQYNGLTYSINSEYDTTCKLAEGDFIDGGINSPSGTVTIPEKVSDGNKTYTVVSIGRWSFAKCETITSVVIPSTVEAIEDGAFQYCYNLESATIGPAVTAIGNEAFAGCYALKSITIPDAVTSIGILAFANCERLEHLSIGSSLKTVGYTPFYQCIGIKHLYIDCESVGKWFDDSKGIETFEAGDMVKAIASETFKGCACLEEIYLGNSLSWIGERTFADCDYITAITSRPRTPPTIFDSTFSGKCNSNAHLSVRLTSEEAYRQAPFWSRFFETDGINEIAEDNPGTQPINISNGTVNNPRKANVAVHSIDGRMIYSGNAALIPLSKGIYVIVSDGVSTKVEIH